MKKLLITACLAAALPTPSLAGNLEQTCTAFDVHDGLVLEAFCLDEKKFQRFRRYRTAESYPIRAMRRTSIYLDDCVGEDAFGNLVFGEGADVASRCHSIGFNDTRQGPMLYATCRDDAGREVDSIPLNLAEGLSNLDGQLVCSFGN